MESSFLGPIGSDFTEDAVNAWTETLTVLAGVMTDAAYPAEEAKV